MYERHDDGYWTFVPNHLPVADGLQSEQFESALASASLAIGRLDGLSLYVPNPEWFVYMYVRKEAVLSAAIEGTQMSLVDLLAAEATPIASPTPTEIRDAGDVSNYVRALTDGIAALNERPLDIALLSVLHTDLLDGPRGQSAMPGKVRTTQNYIGAGRRVQGLDSLHEALFVPPQPHRLPSLLDNCLAYATRDDIPPLVQAAVAHAQFETIHPFLDGNGRLGRLLISLILARRGVLHRPLLYVSEYLAANRREYYTRLTAVRERGDWEGWLVFFLTAVEHTADDACSTARRVVELQQRTLAAVSQRFPNKPNLERAARLLFQTPIVTAKLITERLDVDPATAHSVLADLESLAIMRETTGRKRGRIYRFDAYTDLLGGDPGEVMRR